MKKLLFALGLSAIASSASAALVFDNSINDNFDLSTESRPYNFMYGAVVNTSADVTIREIAARVRLSEDGFVKFLIFDSASGNGGWSGTGNLLFSQIVSVTGEAGPTGYTPGDSGIGYLYSGAMSFTLLAGHTYDIGVLADRGTLTGVWDIDPDAQGSFTSYANNANFNDYDLPTTGGYAGVDVHIKLYDAPVSSVPDGGSTLALFSLGLAGLGLVRRKS